ncbi:rhamnogalacturonan lyase family protein [Konateibacter massiliensis]|uniref:rhamnogalacturonan lyase family protein n=1 Tax=Konateibacter massiliensis TaxID=2002841 RepID=UPI000C15F5E0|nr:InlB B-repeat-containing protein [Konateibacter massiliensis]
MPKRKKIYCCLKRMLVSVLILALVSTNLSVLNVAAYANEAARESVGINATETDGTLTETGENETEEDGVKTETEENVIEETDETQAEAGESDESQNTDETADTEADIDTKETDAAISEEKETSLKKDADGRVLAEEKTYYFGTSKDISSETLFSDEAGYGFSDVTYPDEAKGWVSGIYYPRTSLVEQSTASFVEDGSDYTAISSKAWTETESTGYGVFTYENTSSLDFNLEPANYKVIVELANPTDSEIAACVEAEDITKKSGITVAAGETEAVEFVSCLVDDVLNLKFLGTSTATTEADAETKTVYVKSISLEKLENEAGNKPTIYLASDSTVQTYETYEYPKTGWGQELVNFFGTFVEEREAENCDYSQSQVYETENVIIENRAIGGRSSKSFIEEGKLDDLLEDIKPGDYLFVQWGHNDATYSRPNRWVSSEDFEQWIQYYVDGAAQRGATCVLVTPIARLSYKTTASGELDTFVCDFEAYRNVMKKIAEEQNIPLIDLSQLTIDLCNSFGIEGAKSLFLWLAAGEYDTYPSGSSDATHLQQYGAYKFAQCLAGGIKDNEMLGELAAYVDLTLPSEKPAKPSDLTKKTVGSSSVSMSWTAADSAELYYIYRAELEKGETADDVDFSEVKKYSVSSKNTYTDSSCEGGKTYVYAVAGFNALGQGELSDKLTVTTKTPAYRYDFGIASSSYVMEGWTEITEKTLYSTDTGYGFITPPAKAGRLRSNNGNADSSRMADDFCLGESEFALDVPNGDYEVTIYAGDLLSGTSTIKASYTAEGSAIGTISARQSLESLTTIVNVSDGQLTIGIGGTNPYINGMEVTSLSDTPTEGELVPSEPETLTDRGLVAVNLAGNAGADTSLSATDNEGKEYTKGVYVSWRAFDEDFDSDHNLTTTFTVYRNDTAIATDVKITNLVDEGGSAGDTYRVVGSNDDALGNGGLQVKDTQVWDNQYLELQLYKPADETMPNGKTCTYTANDMSIGDADGDGDYELFVKWYPSNAQDNANSGYTGKTFIDAYDIDMATGEVKLLYRIDFGINIRSGAHYTQFQVWDFDGDGKAELAAKTADGTTAYISSDGTDAGLTEAGYVGECNSDALPTDTISSANDYRNSSGYILNGPEYLTMFDDDGSILDTTDYIPERGDVSAWKDSYGNRVDRFLSAVAYLDGQTPAAVFCRGYYSRTTLTAYCLLDTNNDGFGDTLDIYWKFDSNNLLDEYAADDIEAQGFHNLSVNDVDGDGKDEIVYGSLLIDHDGTLAYTTKLGHGDAMHVSDWVSWNEGLEIMEVHEHAEVPYHVEIHDAKTGEVLMGYYVGKDTGRGAAGDIDPTYLGAEFWSIAGPNYSSSDKPAWNSKEGGVYSTLSTIGNIVTTAINSPASNDTIFWDGDLLSEIFDHTFNEAAYVPLTTTVADWDYGNGTEKLVFESDQVYTSNGTKGNAGLIADILGDWREEMILRCSADNSRIRVYTTTIQTDYVVPCLTENLAYREGVAWENVAYNQMPKLSYLLSENLVTAQLSVEETTKTSITLNFTPANDGTYGNEIQGYEVYRAEGDSENYSLIATILNDDLTAKEGTSGDSLMYVYKDTKVSGGTNYSYKIAAIVNDKTSFLSQVVATDTLVDIKTVKEIILEPIAANTELKEGQTVADLLPASVAVIDQNDKETTARVSWDVSAVDLSTPGSYTVKASVSGYSQVIDVTLQIVENTVTGYTPIANIKSVIGKTVILPETVELTYLNGSKKTVNVAKWNGELDNNTLGTYTLTAELEEQTNLEITIKVIIVNDYVTEITGVLEPIEVLVNSEIKAADLPATVTAKYASGATGAAAISWNTSNLDTSKEGVITIKGNADDYGVSLLARVVKYKALYKFDFGIDAAKVYEGWTGVTVNAKNGTKTSKELGILYSKEKGYGFAGDGTEKIEGRTEGYTHFFETYPLSVLVYNDFVLPAGRTFNVDMENGHYIVEITGGTNTGSSEVRATLEGSVAVSVKNAKNEYNVGIYEVDVADGQLNIAFDESVISRCCSIVIRLAEGEDPTDPTDPVTPVEKFTINFRTNGGSEVAAQTVEAGKLITEPTNPTRAGYIFEGWYKETSLTTKWNFQSDKVQANTILYAKWKAILVSKITIKGQASVIGVDTSNTLTATVTPENAANRAVLWSSSDSKIATVSQNGVVTGKKRGTVTITATASDGSGTYASCKITVGYKITYKLNGGTNNAKNPSGFAGNKAVKLQTPAKKGYVFKGWYTDGKFKTKITQIKKGTKKAVTVYAKWEKITVGKASLKSLTNSGKGKMKMTADAVSKAKGYEFVYATDKKFTKNVTTVQSKSKSTTIKKLIKGSTYYVKVRAYKTDASGNKIYGKYSSVKAVKIKK